MADTGRVAECRVASGLRLATREIYLRFTGPQTFHVKLTSA
jgi:hypothetical protein